MTDTSKKPRETMICTADMPTDYIATNGYEYVLKSKYQSLLEQTEKLEKALEFYADLNNFGKTVWENDERDGHCWYENFDNYEIGEIYGHNSTGDFGIKAEETLEEYRKSKGEV